MTLRCRLLLRAYASERNIPSAALATSTTTTNNNNNKTTITTNSTSNTSNSNSTNSSNNTAAGASPHTSAQQKYPSQQSSYRSSLNDNTTTTTTTAAAINSKREIDALRKELAAAQLRISELRLSQITLHEALLRRLDETDRAAHSTATELRYTALALQCHHDLLETELRRILSINPPNMNSESGMCEEDKIRLRAAAIEAASREMVRKNIGFRVQRVSEEPAPSLRTSDNRESES